MADALDLDIFLTPKGMKDRYFDLFIPVADAADAKESDLSFNFSGINGVMVRRYLMSAYWPSDKEKKEALKLDNSPEAIRRKKRIRHHATSHLAPKSKVRMAWEKSLNAKDSEARDAVRWAYNGKGRPEDYEYALMIAAATGLCGNSKGALQTYCDKHLGLDCSGFVNAYFQAKGYLRGRDSLLISEYAKFPAREKFRDVWRNDCLIYVDSAGKVITGPGHIMLVHDRIAGADKDGKNDVLNVVESRGGAGLSESQYRLVNEKTMGTGKKKNRIFYVNRGGAGMMWVKIVSPF